MYPLLAFSANMLLMKAPRVQDSRYDLVVGLLLASFSSDDLFSQSSLLHLDNTPYSGYQTEHFI